MAKNEQVKKLEKLATPLYCIEVYFVPTTADISAIEQKMRRLQKNKYPFVSWLLVESTTDSDTAVRLPCRTGKRGKPPMRIYGEKINLHLHIVAIGKNRKQSANSFADELICFINKRKGKPMAKKRYLSGTAFINYCCKQTDSFRSGGEFFRKCYKYLDRNYDNNSFDKDEFNKIACAIFDEV